MTQLELLREKVLNQWGWTEEQVDRVIEMWRKENPVRYQTAMKEVTPAFAQAVERAIEKTSMKTPLELVEQYLAIQKEKADKLKGN